MSMSVSLLCVGLTPNRDTNDLLSPGRQIGPEKCPVSATALYTELVDFAASEDKLRELLAVAAAKQQAIEEASAQLPPAQAPVSAQLTQSYTVRFLLVT